MNRRRLRPRWRRVDGIVLLDKPLGITSNDALQRVRRLFNAERAGHTGSLDPLATGLLPICLGEATKLCGILLEADKHYRATVVLGASTTTGDTEGQERERSDPSRLTRSDIERALALFRGPILQVPPMYSAIKQQGQSLYHLARLGQEVERAPRPVYIHHLQVIAWDGRFLELDVICSKGTYIRTLAEDLAGAMGQKAHLSGLRRLGAAPFDGDSPLVTLEQLQQVKDGAPDMLDGLLMPPAGGLRHWPSWRADAAQLAELAMGRRVTGSGLQPGRLAILDGNDRLCGIGRVEAGGVVIPERRLLPE